MIGYIMRLYVTKYTLHLVFYIETNYYERILIKFSQKIWNLKKIKHFVRVIFFSLDLSFFFRKCDFHFFSFINFKTNMEVGYLLCYTKIKDSLGIIKIILTTLRKFFFFFFIFAFYWHETLGALLKNYIIYLNFFDTSYNRKN